MLIFWSLVRNSVVLAVYLLFSVACFLTVHEHSLHAWRVHFFHPDTGKEIRIEAPIPEDMCRLIGSDTVSRETFKEEIK